MVLDIICPLWQHMPQMQNGGKHLYLHHCTVVEVISFLPNGYFSNVPSERKREREREKERERESARAREQESKRARASERENERMGKPSPSPALPT